MYLLDSNVVIDYLKAALPLKAMQFLHTVVDERPTLSVITKKKCWALTPLPSMNKIS